MKKIIMLISAILCVPVVGFLALLAYLTITEHTPKEQSTVFSNDKPALSLDSDKEFSAVIWNIGYAGLSANQNFFYDGGEDVRPTQKVSQSNFAGIQRNLNTLANNTDFLLLQEVDQNSKRSYGFNQYHALQQQFANRHTAFAYNYKVNFVPLPVTEPMGKVNSGLASISTQAPINSVRYSFPSAYDYPKRVAMLKRAFLTNRFALDNGKQLVVINTHNTAYSDKLKEQEMQYFSKFLQAEYNKGNYVVVGGDWNQLPNKHVANFANDKPSNDNVRINADFVPDDWTWGYDNSVPTCRKLATPYTKGVTPTQLIDFFLVSPNVTITDVTGVHLDFEHSDHNPVKLSFKLK